MRLCLLGPLVFEDEGATLPVGPPKERRVLAALAINANRVVSEDALIDALWSDDPPRSAARTLQAHVSRLRRTLGGDTDAGLAIETSPSGYLLRAAPDSMDVAVMEGVAGRAQLAAQSGDHEEAARLLGVALRMWRGRALDDLADEAFAMNEANRLEELRLSLLEERVEAELALGRHTAAVADLEALTAAHPLRERLWGQRMIALYRAGRQSEALRAFQNVRRVLAEELGLEPSRDLRSLEAAILAQSTDLDWVAPARRGSAAALADERPGGPVTFLMTDIVDSTPLWDSQSDAMAVALVRHDELIDAAVRDAGGNVVKSKGEGDSTMSVFADAAAGVAAAVAIQRAIASEAWTAGLHIRVRAALHTGEAHKRGGDYYGSALSRAARLRALAGGGQVVVSEATADAVRATGPLPTDLVFSDLGIHRLRGLARPERVYALRGPGLANSAATSPRANVAMPLPLPLDAGLGHRFVGREEELGRLSAAWKEVAAGDRRAALIGGEPGIGKTALAAELARQAYAEGAVVLFGRCDEDLGAPYQPFIEALSEYVEACPADVLAAQAGRRAGDLARLLPAVREAIPDLPPPTNSPPEEARHLMFDAVALLMRSMTESAPVVLVIDDLHWGAKPTLLLLRHLLRPTERMPLLVVATYRQTELDRKHPLAETLADLRRTAGVDRLPLAGLGVAEVCDLVEADAGVTLDDTGLAVAVAICEQAEGNPFFVRELARHLAESGQVDFRAPRAGVQTTVEALGIPAGVREVIGRRLSRLSDSANLMLAAAAVLGRDFSLAVVAAMLGVDESVALDAAEEAMAANIVREVAAGRFTFAHALIRHSLYNELSSSRRLLLHRQAGEALEQQPGAGGRADELAHHFSEAAAVGGAAKAVDYAAVAGAAAVDAMAYERALELYTRALEAHAVVPGADLRMRGVLYLGRSRAYRALAQMAEQRADALAAAADARATGYGALLAMATMSLSWLPAGDREGHNKMCHDALGLLGDDDINLRAVLLFELAVEEMQLGSTAEATRLASESIALAREAGDDAALANALFPFVISLMWSDRTAERLAAADECVALSTEGDVAIALRPDLQDVGFLDSTGLSRQVAAGRRLISIAAEQPGVRVRAPLRLEIGDLRGFDEDVETLAAAGKAQRNSQFVCHSLALRSVRALIAGRFTEAEALGAEMVPLVTSFTAATLFWETQTFRQRELGELAGSVVTMRNLGSFLPNLDVVAAAFDAVDAAEYGRVDEAAALLAGIGTDDITQMYGSVLIGVVACALAEVSFGLNDPRLVPVLVPVIAPVSGRLVPGVTAGASPLGPADRYLGVLASAVGDWEEAERRFAAALDFERTLDSPPLAARTRYWWARMLLTRGRPGDVSRADQLAASARTTAEELGMKGLVAALQRLRN